MSDDELPPDEDDQKPNWRRELEDRLKQAETRASTAERKAALMEAGVDINTPTGKLFAKAYDGDADVEAIRKQAEEYGVLKPSDEQIPPEELQAMQQTAAASVGAQAPAAVDAEKRFEQAMAAAKTQEEAEAVIAQFQGEIPLQVT